ncbi:UNVERIFIED_CONTAM: hypothetical protein HHA_271935 [Hammondia hammondi]|eukprot:XP_008882539.1 hypothetical protein HHA_271935 [Hammondia hammondi]
MEKHVAKPSSRQYIVEGPVVNLSVQPAGYELNPPQAAYYAFQAAGKTVRIVIERTGDKPIQYSCPQPAKQVDQWATSAAQTSTAVEGQP